MQGGEAGGCGRVGEEGAVEGVVGGSRKVGVVRGVEAGVGSCGGVCGDLWGVEGAAGFLEAGAGGRGLGGLGCARVEAPATSEATSSSVDRPVEGVGGWSRGGVVPDVSSVR